MKNIFDVELEVREREQAIQEDSVKVKHPSMYHVLMHNDDFTPMEFVVSVLEMFLTWTELKRPV